MHSPACVGLPQTQCRRQVAAFQGPKARLVAAWHPARSGRHAKAPAGTSVRRVAVHAAQPASATAPPSSAAGGGEGGVLDVVVVGAGISGLTTAQVSPGRGRGEEVGQASPPHRWLPSAWVPNQPCPPRAAGHLPRDLSSCLPPAGPVPSQTSGTAHPQTSCRLWPRSTPGSHPASWSLSRATAWVATSLPWLVMVSSGRRAPTPSSPTTRCSRRR